MSTLNPVISFIPSEEDMEHILSWTCFPSSNWSEIISCYDRKCLVVAKLEGRPIGFLAYKYETVCIFISIADVHPERQNKGVAKLLVSALCERYRNSRYKALNLYCSPKESQFAWEKIGFNHYPKRARKNRNEVYMYLIFGDACEVMPADEKMGDTANVVQIFDSEVPRDDDPASWYAAVDFDQGSNKLNKPLLFFGNEKWQIRISTGGVERFRGRYVDYDRKSDVYECLYIEELKGPGFR